ncbi:MAG: response regulator [Oligoflexia bacterium]|nr:response regulator [Oligoflexia bacterium]
MSQDLYIISIDDEADITALYEPIVHELGFKYEGFSDFESFKLFLDENQNRIAFVISDYKMPEKDGFEVRKYMNENGMSSIPFLLVTGFYTKEMASEGMNLKICSFIEKPFLNENIEDVIKEHSAERVEAINEEREMIGEFLNETQPMLEEIEELILSLEEDPHDMKAVNTYFRLLHTIKGTSSCLGLNEIADYAHQYEDLITKVKNCEISANSAVVNVLLKGLDDLKNLYKIASEGKAYPPNLEEMASIFTGDFKVADANLKQAVEEGQAKEEDKEEKKPKAQDEKVNVSVGLLGEFLEMSGELTVIRNTIFKNLNKLNTRYKGDKDIDLLIANMGEMQKISSILQNQISEIKKITMESVFRPMKRVVRDSCNATGKEVDFSVSGGDLRVDTSVGKLLNNVLVHLLRNGVDHGIEDAEKRLAAGKDAKGKLDLTCYETGENIFVEIQDDGGGINPDFIKKKALEKGLYTEDELSHMSDQKVFSIIFESGFSTNTEVTSISGRGVGMDMVRSSVEDVGGKIYIDSVVGEGSKFVLMIPIPRSILIINSLMVSTASAGYNIPLDDVAEVILFNKDLDSKNIHQVEGSHILKHHGDLIPLVNLDCILNEGSSFELNDLQSIVVLRGDGYKYGLVVDQILDIEEIVVKKLSPMMKDRQEYLGVTFIGDGDLGLILDPEGIAKKLGIESITEDSAEHLFKASVASGEELEFMKFKLEADGNYCLPLEWVHRLEKFKGENVQFTGTKALLRYRGKSLPLINVAHALELNESFKNYPDVFDTIVIKNEKNELFGLIVQEMMDIGKSHTHVDTNMSDRNGVSGTIYLDEKIYTVVEPTFLISLNEKRIELKSESKPKDNVVELNNDVIKEAA